MDTALEDGAVDAKMYKMAPPSGRTMYITLLCTTPLYCTASVVQYLTVQIAYTETIKQKVTNTLLQHIIRIK